MCNGVDHLPKDCPTYVEMREWCNALGFPNSFNQQWQPNLNLSWRNNLVTQPTQWRPNAQPSRTYQAHPSNVPPPLSLEDAFKSFMKEQVKMNKQIMDEQREFRSQLTKLTNSLATQEQGKLPSQTQPNPSSQNTRGVNSITTWSGKVVDVSSPSTSQPVRFNDEGIDRDEVEPIILLPFPQALKVSKFSLDHGEIIDQLKQVKMNRPLLHVIKKIPFMLRWSRIYIPLRGNIRRVRRIS